MSFNELSKSNYSLKKNKFTVKVGDKEYNFTAVQPSYTERLAIDVAKINGGDFFLDLVIKTIVDENGQKMSEEQAKKLPDDIMARFVQEAILVLEEVKPEAEAKTKKKAKSN